MVATLVAAVAAFAPSSIAAISTQASTVYGSTVPGAHTDYTIIQQFQYGNGAEPTASTGPGQDLKKWIADSPAGLIGNPNAVPFADRCNPAAFDPSGVLSPYVALGSCPASAQVGEADVYLVSDGQTGTTCPSALANPGYPLDCIAAGFPMSALGGPMKGKIYILQTSPEMPVTLGTLFTSTSYQSLPNPQFPIACTAAPTCPLQPKTKSILAPVTNRSADLDEVDDFRIRTIPADYNTAPAALLPTSLGHPSWSVGGKPLHLARIDQKLYGMADPNNTSATPGVGDTPFLTMPTRCDSWDSTSYAISYLAGGDGGTLPMDPNNPSDMYVKSPVDAVTPDCTTKPPFNATASAVLTGGARDANPGLTVTVNNPTANGDDEVRKMVTTMPAALTVDVDVLDKVCSVVDRNADNCPAASQIGTATIQTPLLSAGLTGRVYMTKSPDAGLPYLSIFLDGAIKARLDATTKFVGPGFNQIEMTFNMLPQAPFPSFVVNIAGGQPNSLLYTRACSSAASSWDDGPLTFGMDSYTGQASASTSASKLDSCLGANRPATRNHCIRPNSSAQFRPQGVQSISRVKRVQLQTGRNTKTMRSNASRSKAPFQLRRTMSTKTYRPGSRYRYGYRITYDDGRVVRTSTAFFRVCR